MVNFNPYLQSIGNTYAQWWDCYTITDVVGNLRHEQQKRSAMLPLSPFFNFGLMVEKVKQQQEEETERLTVIEGLRKYADKHVLLIGRPGSGKSTALLRLLLEETSPHERGAFSRRVTPRLLGEGLNSPHSLVGKGAGGLGQIPILIELRFYKTSIIELIRDCLKRHQLWLEIAEIEKLLFAGKFLLLIDGVNELPSEAARQDLQKFRQDYQKTTPMIFTTRDLGVGGDLGIEKKLQMQPLTETQMRDFVCGYLPEQGEEMLKQLSGRLQELGETPLLLMMLCSVFVDNQNKVPSNLGSVFRRFTEIYDNKFKQDIPVTDESRRWWKRLLQHLAWVMTHGGTSPQTPRLLGEGLHASHSLVGKGAGGLGFLKTEILVAIPIQEARNVLTQFLKEQDYHQPRDAEKWLDDLLKHHLIQLGAENQIQFRHQLLQEYYAAERLLEELPKLSDDDLQWEYLNYLKWTEVVALMMQLVDKQYSAVGLVKLALGVDWQLGARLAGEVREEWQGETVGLIDVLGLPKLLEIRLLNIIQSNVTVDSLIEDLKSEEYEVCIYAANTLAKIGSDIAIPALVQVLQHEYFQVRESAVKALGQIGSDRAIHSLIEVLKNQDEDDSVRDYAAVALGKMSQINAIKAVKIELKNKVNQDDNRSFLSHAATALGEIGSDTAISLLIELLKDKYWSVRANATLSLGKIASEKAVPALVEMLRDEDADVRAYSAEALSNIRSKVAIPALTEVLQDQDSNVRITAKLALDEICSHKSTSENNLDISINVDKKASKTYIESLWDAAARGQLSFNTYLFALIRKIKYDFSDLDSDRVISSLTEYLKQEDYVKAIGGANLELLMYELEKTQQHLKYYKPIPKLIMSNTSHNYALLIGVGECDEDKLSLPVTVKDIQALKSLLTDSNLCGYIDNNIRLLYNKTATKEKILENLNWLKQQAENDPEATILIYYSGHGCLDNSQNYYLIPHETDRADIPDTALSAETLNQALREIPAQRLLVIIDSCHAQGMATSKDDAGNNKRSPIPKSFTQTALPKTIIDDLKGTGRVVFTSSTGTQLSWIRSDREMSIYTYHLLEALQGAGNQPGDKTVKVSHLMNYLSKTVPSTTQQEYQTEQTPFFDFATEDFPVALLRGGKGLPEEGYESVKAEAEENIRSISNKVKDGVGIVGDRNIGFNIGTAGNITFGDISSK
ncbi:HEAT repeat domain-containing protein [Calothrix sp. CCY 0018]|uniref:HEAT repeat domain-containing protein n=1 Tax=Calothrix sp. CCY 0018 TaxID=3103864 RepID=UPI0039C71494